MSTHASFNTSRVSVTPTIPEEPEDLDRAAASAAAGAASRSPATTAPLTFEKVVPRQATHSSLSMLSSLSLKSLIDARIAGGRSREPSVLPVPEQGIGAQTPFDDAAMVPPVQQQEEPEQLPLTEQQSHSQVAVSPTNSEQEAADEATELTTQALRKLSVLRIATQGIQQSAENSDAEEEGESDGSPDSSADEETLKMGRSESNFTATQVPAMQRARGQPRERGQLGKSSTDSSTDKTEQPSTESFKNDIAPQSREPLGGGMQQGPDAFPESIEKSSQQSLQSDSDSARQAVEVDSSTEVKDVPASIAAEQTKSQNQVAATNAHGPSANSSTSSMRAARNRDLPVQSMNMDSRSSAQFAQTNSRVQSQFTAAPEQRPQPQFTTAPEQRPQPQVTSPSHNPGISRTNVMTLTPRAFPATPSANTPTPAPSHPSHAKTVKQISNPKKAMYVPAVLRNVQDTNLTAGDLRPIPERDDASSTTQGRPSEPTVQEYLAMFSSSSQHPPSQSQSNGLHSERDSARGSVHSNASSIYSAYKQRFYELLGGSTTNSRGQGGSNGHATRQPTRVHWVPDAERTNCAKCHTRFSLLERKHHCRHCGEIFCARDLPDMVYLNGEAHFCQLRQFGGGVLVKVCHACAVASEEYMQAIKQQKLQRLQEGMAPDENGTPRRGKGMSRAPARRRDSVAGSVPADWNWSSF